jgi:hypothetical protein
MAGVTAGSSTSAPEARLLELLQGTIGAAREAVAATYTGDYAFVADAGELVAGGWRGGQASWIGCSPAYLLSRGCIDA